MVLSGQAIFTLQPGLLAPRARVTCWDKFCKQHFEQNKQFLRRAFCRRAHARQSHKGMGLLQGQSDLVSVCHEHVDAFDVSDSLFQAFRISAFR